MRRKHLDTRSLTGKHLRARLHARSPSVAPKSAPVGDPQSPYSTNELNGLAGLLRVRVAFRLERRFARGHGGSSRRWAYRYPLRFFLHISGGATLPLYEHRSRAHQSGRQMIKRAPLELPPKVARRFVEDRRAFFAERDVIKQDEIAARQLYALREHYSGKLRLMDIKMMFSMMIDDLEKEAD